MKRARISKRQWECSRCEGPIFPGHVYLDDCSRDQCNPTQFHQSRTCATCVNVEPRIHGCIEETDAFWEWVYVWGMTPKDGSAEVLLARWRKLGRPCVCVACGGAGEVLGDFGESLVPCSRCGGGPSRTPEEARAALLPEAPATPDAGTRDVSEAVAARAVLSELEKLRVWTAVERGAFIDGWVGRARARPPVCGGSVCGWAGDDCVCRHHPNKSPT